MKRMTRMKGILRKRLAGGMHPSVVKRSGRQPRRPETTLNPDDYLREVASKFDLTPQEVLRRGVAMFVIAAEAEEAGNSVVVLDRDDVVVREYTDFRRHSTPALPDAPRS